MTADTVLVAAGGTGGHVFPGLATAAALRRAHPDLAVEFVGTAERLEATLVPAAGYTLHTVPAMAWSRTLSPLTLKLPWVLGRAVGQVRRLIATRRVIAAVGFGGYTSVPLAVAARLTGIPLVVHEQNAVVGLANRLAGRIAAAVAVSFPQTAGDFPGIRTVVTGNPVRPDLLVADTAGEADLQAARRALRPEGLAAFGLDPARQTLLVFGGSQGARRINQAVTGSAGLWTAPGDLQILHATGRRTHTTTVAAWAAAGIDPDGDAGPDELKVVCRAFIDRMDLAYAAADVVVCRAGASSVAELTALALPAVLVPYPHATADHQTANARALGQAGGAIVVDDAATDATSLTAAAEPLLTDPARHAAMQAAAAAFGRPDAAVELASLVIDVSAAAKVRS